MSTEHGTVDIHQSTPRTDSGGQEKVTKARSLLELARLKHPKNAELWLEAVRLERRPFSILLLGGVLGGIATSLLFSVFEAWLIQAHALQNIDPSVYLAQSFSVTQFGSSVVVIVSGLIANYVVSANDSNDSHTSLRPLFWKAARKWAIQEAWHDDADWQTSNQRFAVAYLDSRGGIRAFDLSLLPLLLCLVLTSIIFTI